MEEQLRANTVEEENGGHDSAKAGPTAPVAKLLIRQVAAPLSALSADCAAASNLARRCTRSPVGQSCPALAALEGVTADAARLRAIFNGLHRLARREVWQRQLEDVNKVVVESLELAPKGVLSAQVQVRSRLRPRLPRVWMDKEQIQRVLMHLLSNASDSLGARGGKPRVIELQTRHLNQDQVEILVGDNGPGIPTELLPQLSRSLYTSKPKGTGIGLLICRAIMEGHQGTLRLENAGHGGALVRLTLPVGRESL